MKHLYISVAGVMGSGKTSVGRLLAEQLGWHFFEENIQENVFLPRYYENPEVWALHSQLFYLREKASQLLRLREKLQTANVVQDTPIYQDGFTYAKAQHLLKYMTDDDHALYLKFFELLENQLPTPDLVIQLDAPIPVLLERIAQRGRVYEKAVDDEYLVMLSDLQDDWIKKNSKLTVMRVPTDNQEFDILTNQTYQQTLLKKIKSYQQFSV